jgi:group I intron endonuclease
MENIDDKKDEALDQTKALVEIVEITSKCKIYLLTNIKNNKVYVGQTWLTLKARWGKDGVHYKGCTLLYNAILKYGCENFKYLLLTECDTQEEADRLENEYMIKYDSRNPAVGYNLKSGGSAGKHSEETKKIIGETGRGRKHSIESVRRRAEKIMMPKERELAILEAYNSGKQVKDIVKEFSTGTSSVYRILDRHGIKRTRSKAQWTGRTHTEETKAKMAEARKEYWQNK